MRFVYIYPDGRLLSKEYFDYAAPFRDGHAAVTKDGDRFSIDQTGRKIT
jgi:hypothetical protein